MNGDLALLVLRVAVGVVMFAHGAMKLGWVGKGGSPAGTAGWFTSIGIRPGLFWAWVVILAEAGGGVLTILGLGGPIGPGIVAGDLVVAIIVAHIPKGFWNSQGGLGVSRPIRGGRLRDSPARERPLVGRWRARTHLSRPARARLARDRRHRSPALARDPGALRAEAQAGVEPGARQARRIFGGRHLNLS